MSIIKRWKDLMWLAKFLSNMRSTLSGSYFWKSVQYLGTVSFTGNFIFWAVHFSVHTLIRLRVSVLVLYTWKEMQCIFWIDQPVTLGGLSLVSVASETEVIRICPQELINFFPHLPCHLSEWVCSWKGWFCKILNILL